MERDYSEEDRYLRAQKKVKDIKGFYSHFTAYSLVNLFISTMKIMENMKRGETFDEAFFDFSTFAVWIFWGIGVLFHGIHVFGDSFIFSKNWEERKMKKIMEEDESEFYENR